MAMTEEEKKLRNRKSVRQWLQNHPEYKKIKNERRNKKRMEDEEWHKKEKEQRKKFYRNHKDNPEWVKKQNECRNKWYKDTMFYNSRPIYMIFNFYYNKNYSRYISLYGYFTVLKTPDETLRRSIMIRLGKGSIDEEEAIRLSGQLLTQEDIDFINSYDYKPTKKNIIRNV